MMNIGKHIFRWVLFVLIQGLVLGQLNFEHGIHPMIYPLFIILLPFNTTPILLMTIAFATGICVDFFMNTFGLHASSAVVVAYLRSFIYKKTAPRDGYDLLKEPTANEWGYIWFSKIAIPIILIHHAWFFSLEYFKLHAWLTILNNTFLSAIATFIIFIIIQVIFFNKRKDT